LRNLWITIHKPLKTNDKVCPARHLPKPTAAPARLRNRADVGKATKRSKKRMETLVEGSRQALVRQIKNPAQHAGFDRTGNL
jgi:hypothetical protein